MNTKKISDEFLQFLCERLSDLAYNYIAEYQNMSLDFIKKNASNLIKN